MSGNARGHAGIGDRNRRSEMNSGGVFKWKQSTDGTRYFAPTDDLDSFTLYIDVSHTHTVSGTTGGSVANTTWTTPTFTGTAGTTSSTTPTFTGTAGTTSSNGSGSSFSILPLYVVKYCWERTA